MLTDTDIYGTTTGGGPGLRGVLYRFELSGGQYHVLHNFSIAVNNGAVPYTAPTLLNEALYGLAFRGGANDLGCIYRFDLTAREFSVLYSFDAASGKNPLGGLTVVGEWLYGMTSDHLDQAAYGTIFRIHPDGSAFETVHRFGGGADGGYPYDSLVFDGHRSLYGTTLGYYTDLADEGVLFRFDVAMGEYRVLHNFGLMEGDGAKLNGNPVLSSDGTTLYCLAHGSEVWGGPEYGTLFSVKSDGSAFEVLHTFRGGYAGDTPMRTPVLDGSVLLGTTAVGGNPQDPSDHWLDGRGYGLIWRFNVNPAPTAAELDSFDGIDIGGSQVLFRWRTLLEVNLIGFLVEYSQDGLRWERASPGVAPATGIGGHPQTYTIRIDVGISTSATRYRLLALRRDGTSDVIATTKVLSTPSVKLERVDGAFQVRAAGIPGRAARLEFTSDLRDPSWTIMARQLFGVDGTVVFKRVSVQDDVARFFRVLASDW